jgi:anti-sigma factor RsiW
MSLQCEAMVPLLVRAADSQLSAADQTRLDQHVAGCAACAEALSEQRAARASLTSLAATPVTTHVRARVLAQLRDEAARAEGSWRDAFNWQRWTWRLVPVALVLAVAAAGTSSPLTAGTAPMGTDEVTTDGTSGTDTGTLVSSAMVTGEVAGDALLSLMLSASTEDAMSTLVQGGTQ